MSNLIAQESLFKLFCNITQAFIYYHLWELLCAPFAELVKEQMLYHYPCSIYTKCFYKNMLDIWTKFLYNIMECSFSPESIFLLKPCGIFAPVYHLFSLHICTYVFKDLRTQPFTEFLCPGSFTHLYFLSERAQPTECLLENGKMLVELNKLHLYFSYW